MKSAAAILLVCALLAEAVTAQPPASAASLKPLTNGTASNFGGYQDQQNPFVASAGLVDGSCGFGALAPDHWPYWAVAGISPNSTLVTGNSTVPDTTPPKGACGICLSVVCHDPVNCAQDAAPVVVQVVDSCDDCKPNQLNLHYLTFDRYIADGSLGNVSVQYQQVECKPPGPVQGSIHDYRASGGGWVTLALKDVAGAAGISSVELRGTPSGQGGASISQTITAANSSWRQMRNTYGAVWEMSGLPPLPWDLRITSATMPEQLIARGVVESPVAAGKTFVSKVQFSTSSTPAYIGQPGSILEAAPATNSSMYNAAGPGGRSTTPTLAPRPGCVKTPYELLKTLPEASTFLRLADQAGLTPSLKDPNATFTLLVPTNEAWAALSPNLLNTSDTSALQLVLLYHVLPGQLRSADVRSSLGNTILPEDLVDGSPSILADTVNGLRLRVVGSGIPGQLRFMGQRTSAQGVKTDEFTCSAVIDTISAVLLP